MVTHLCGERSQGGFLLELMLPIPTLSVEKSDMIATNNPNYSKSITMYSMMHDSGEQRSEIALHVRSLSMLLIIQR
jgi:hypothetical protein